MIFTAIPHEALLNFHFCHNWGSFFGLFGRPIKQWRFIYYVYDVDFGQTHVPLGKPVLGRKDVYVPLDPVFKLNVSQYLIFIHIIYDIFWFMLHHVGSLFVLLCVCSWKFWFCCNLWFPWNCRRWDLILFDFVSTKDLKQNQANKFSSALAASKLALDQRRRWNIPKRKELPVGPGTPVGAKSWFSTLSKPKKDILELEFDMVWNWQIKSWNGLYV